MPAAQPGHWLGASDKAGPAGSNPALVGRARASLQKKKKKREWAESGL
jgi:hypothetical protein